jgi:hypothetical protein
MKAQVLWIAGAPVAHTPRQELRLALRAGCSMDRAEVDYRRGLMSLEAYQRFERLFAVSTATEHRYTRGWSLERWRSRRDRVCKAVRGYLAKPQ